MNKYEELEKKKSKTTNTYEIMEISNQQLKHVDGFIKEQKILQNERRKDFINKRISFFKNSKIEPEYYKVGVKKGTPKELTKLQIKKNKENIKKLKYYEKLLEE